MAHSGPPTDGGDLLMPTGQQVSSNPAGRVDAIIQCPAEEGLPEVVRILIEDFLFNLSSDEEEIIDVERVSIDDGQYFPLPPGYEEEDEEDEEEDEEEDQSSEWNDSEDGGEWSEESSQDSGYETMDDDDKSLDGPENEDIGPPYPLIQQFSPEEFWRSVDVPFDVLPQEEPGPSTSGLSTSVKRSRNDGWAEEVSSKRARVSIEENPEESRPSTPSIFINRHGEESYRDPAPSTSSGLNSVGNRAHWFRPFRYPESDDSDSD